MAAVVCNTQIAANNQNRSDSIASQPMPEHRDGLPLAAVQATSAGPVVLAAVVAPATKPGKTGYFRYSGAKPWSRAVLENLLPANPVRALFPFGGSASDAFGYVDLFEKIVVADANADIINAHKWVVAEPEKVIEACQALFADYGSSEGFEQVRAAFRAGTPDNLIHAAQYIYLQQHNKGGISRYSKMSGYNASFAKDNDKDGASRKRVVPAAAIRRFAKQFAKADLVHAKCLATLAMAGKGDVALLDPPYNPLAGQKKTHNQYTAEGFHYADHEMMVKAAEAACRRGATIFVHDHDTTQTRELHKHCTEILPVLVLRKNGETPEYVAEAVFIYRPVAAAQVVATPKIVLAPAANDQMFAAFNKDGYIDEPHLAVAYEGKGNIADATLWAHPVDGKWYAGIDYAFRSGQYQAETLLPAKLDKGYDTASLAIESAAVRLLSSLDAKFPDLGALVQVEASQVSAMRGWLNAQIEGARKGGFEPKPTFTFIDLFAGIGGFHLAMKQVGGKCVLACEINEESRKTYLANHDMTGVTFAADITKLEAALVPDHDVLCAGFPCQAFSIAGGKHGFDDQRGGLIFDMLRIIKAKRPKLLLLENVKNFCSGEGGKWSSTLRRRLAGMGYAVSAKVLNAARFSTAQERERVFFVAYRRDVFANVQGFQFPLGDGKWVSVADILEADAPEGHYGADRIDLCPTVDKSSPLQRVGMLKDRDGKVRHGQDARVYDTNFHATTLMASQDNCGVYLVNGKARSLTPRERARLQGFPDTFQPHPVKTHANRQLGNSIAVPVAAAIAKAMNQQFFNQAA